MNEYREEYRQVSIGRRYSGPLHLFVTTTGAVAGVVAVLWQVHDVSWRELLVVPFAFLFANVVEHQVHKRVMHVPRGPLRFLYARHTLQHHRFFQPLGAGDLAVSTTRDWKIVLFPPAVIVFFLGGIGLPVSLGLAHVVDGNAGPLFGATAIGYFLVYEYCHLAWHQPDSSFIARVPLVRRFRAHHHAHHRDATRAFNVTFPIADLFL